MRRRVRTAALAMLAAAVLTSCGSSDVRNFLDDTYEEQSTAGDTTTYRGTGAVGATAGQISGAVPPAARATDAGSEYLRYDDDIVVVSPADGASNVRVEDLDGPYRAGAYAYLGPGFDPGSPAGNGEEDAK